MHVDAARVMSNPLICCVPGIYVLKYLLLLSDAVAWFIFGEPPVRGEVFIGGCGHAPLPFSAQIVAASTL